MHKTCHQRRGTDRFDQAHSTVSVVSCSWSMTKARATMCPELSPSISIRAARAVLFPHIFEICLPLHEPLRFEKPSGLFCSALQRPYRHVLSSRPLNEPSIPDRRGPKNRKQWSCRHVASPSPWGWMDQRRYGLRLRPLLRQLGDPSWHLIDWPACTGIIESFHTDE